MKNKELSVFVVYATRDSYRLSDGTTHQFVPPLKEDPKVEDVQRYYRQAVAIQNNARRHFAATGGIKWAGQDIVRNKNHTLY